MDISQDDLMNVFILESEENFDTMEQTLLALEKEPGSAELLQELFRAAHTLKGNAACVGLNAIGELAHIVEDCLDDVRGGRAQMRTEVVTALLDAVDALRIAVAAAVAGEDSIPPDAAGVIADLRMALDRSTAAERPLSGAPEARAERGESAGGGAATLRVAVDRLDRMLNLTGEAAIARGRIRQLLERRASYDELLEAHREADRLHMDMQELLMKMRMVPLGPTFRQHARTIRDVGLARGKQVRLITEGADVELDTRLVEHLRDPLTHIVRNAVDHGIESPEQRVACGKNPCGTIVLRAEHESGSIRIEVSDDGKGLDTERIRVVAVEQGLLSANDKLSDTDVANLIFRPGFTTASTVTDVSGRGVGMDVVRRNIEALHGSIAIDSRPAAGTTISLRLPLTLAIIEGFSVGVGEQIFVIPMEAVVEGIEVRPADAPDDALTGVLDLRGNPLPWVRLRKLFGIGSGRPARENAIVVRYGDQCAGVVVDRLYGDGQTVIKPLGQLFKNIPGVAGSSILGSGRVALILDVAALLRDAVSRQELLAAN